jgi:transposase
MTITRKKVRRKLFHNKILLKSKKDTFKKIIKNIKGDDIISIDETSIDNQLYPLYGWSLKGKRIIIQKQAVRVRYTVITAISKDRIIHYDIIKNSANAVNFKNFIEKLVNKGVNNKYLLVDNARIHHAKIVKDYMNTTSNTFVYNVPYSPEFNPIEHVFSKLKNILRNKINNTKIKIIKNIHSAFRKVTSVELRNYYKYSLNK